MADQPHGHDHDLLNGMPLVIRITVAIIILLFIGATIYVRFFSDPPSR